MSKDFKTKLRFEPSKLSTSILKRYLIQVIDDISPIELFELETPSEYLNDPDDVTNYVTLKDLALMSVTDWVAEIDHNQDIENLYLNNDTMLKDSQYYYECYKIIQNEISGHAPQMSFFRIVSEIVKDLSSRSLVEISNDGKLVNEIDMERSLLSLPDPSVASLTMEQHSIPTMEQHSIPAMEQNENWH